MAISDGEEADEGEGDDPPGARVAPVQIPLGKSGRFALVDAADAERVLAEGLRWHPDLRPSGVTYARAMRTIVRGRSGHRAPVYLHRLVLGVGPTEEVDHVDFDGLNNRRSNLRPCSAVQNTQYRRSPGIKGARRAKNGAGWTSRIVAPSPDGGSGREIYLGTYRTREDAGSAYDVAAMHLFGEFALTNFPISEYSEDRLASLRASRLTGANGDRGGLRGVSFNKRLGKWQASICAGEIKPNGKRRQLYLGVFADPAEAARAYDRKALEAFGEFASTNFPEAAPGLAACRALVAAYRGDSRATELALADMAEAIGGRP